ncbi:trypsin-like serine protease [Kitasatospora sp. NPDC057904]|uniref:trypsin-like serine protease n=1 Tax=Kitasatospora sp. NPDC057904 TaxID=3346275 RepID=UPI0036DBB898
MRTVRRLAWPLGAALAIPVVAAPMPAVAADAAPPSAVEGFSYPDAAKVLADRNITLKTGDGHIVLADCASGPGLVQLFSRTASPSEVCFKITGPTGYLALEIPQVYNIKGDDHAIKATLNTAGTVSSIDVNKNAWTPVGEGGTSGSTTLLELTATDGPAAPANTDFPAVGTVTAGQPGRADARSCTATLVDRYWVLTAASCFGDHPAAGAPATASTATIAGRTIAIAELAPRAERDLVMARLTSPLDGVAPIAVTGTAPAAGDGLRIPGYGRTTTDWAPLKLHTSAHTTGAVNPTSIDTAPAAGQAPVCQGDTGAPLLRDRNGTPEIASVASLSWQGGCLGTPATETRTGATSSRVDDLNAWIQQVKASRPGSRLFAIGSDNRIWANEGSYSTNVWGTFEAVPQNSGIRQVSAVTMGTTVRLFAIGSDQRIWSASKDGANGTWSAFQMVPGNSAIQQVTAVAMGDKVRLFAIGGDGQIWTSTGDYTAGTWSTFQAIPSSAIKNITAVAMGDKVRLFAVGGDGQIWTTTGDYTAGTWSTFQAIPSSAIKNITAATIGNTVHLFAVGGDDRIWTTTGDYTAGTWTTFNAVPNAAGVKQVAATTIGDTARLFAIGADDRIWTADQKADNSWTTFYAVASSGIQGIAATPAG